jgi:hypothetical protein
MRNKIKTLISEFQLITQEYLREFERKQDCKFDYWVNGISGGRAVFKKNEELYGIDFYNIRMDVDLNIDEGLIFKWFNELIYDEYAYDYSYFVNNL